MLVSAAYWSSNIRILYWKLKFKTIIKPYHKKTVLIWSASSEKVHSNMRKMLRFSSSCACVMYHSGLCNRDMHFGSEKGRPWSDCADAQADLGLRCPHMPEDSVKSRSETGWFSDIVAQLSKLRVYAALRVIKHWNLPEQYWNMGLAMRKHVFGHMRTAKAHISLRIHTF